MNIGALLKSFIYLIASSLLYPVLVLLVVMTIWIIIYSGSFFAEWIERRRLIKYPPERLPSVIKDKNAGNAFPYRVSSYLKSLENIIEAGQAGDVEIENIFQENTLKIWKSMDLLHIFVRLSPGLGLIGTLIPMGTGLAALGQGDMSRLAGDLVIAFTTTVVGLSIGMLSFFFYTVKKRWAEEDIKNMELATEVLTREKQ